MWVLSKISHVHAKISSPPLITTQSPRGEGEGGGDVILFNAFVLIDITLFASKKTHPLDGKAGFS
jgi:hypothetical protein